MPLNNGSNIVHDVEPTKRISESWCFLYPIDISLASLLILFYHLNMHSNMNLKKIRQELDNLDNKEAILKCAREFGLVGDPTRMKICWLLCKHKELSVSEIAKILDVSVSVVSHSLRKLRRHKLVQSRRNFRQVFYRLSNNHFNHLLKKQLTKI